MATNLGFWLTEEAEYDEAAQLLDKGLAIRQAVFGESHPQVASTLSIKANLLRAVHDVAGAREAANRARTILAENLSEDHWRVAMAASTEGAALTELGRYQDAETLLARSAEILKGGGAATELLARQSQERLERLHAVWKK